jgi:hypothetical protein
MYAEDYTKLHVFMTARGALVKLENGGIAASFNLPTTRIFAAALRGNMQSALMSQRG